MLTSPQTKYNTRNCTILEMNNKKSVYVKKKQNKTKLANILLLLFGI